MIDPVLATLLWSTLTYGLCGSAAGVGMRLLTRGEGPRLDQSAAVGFLIGAAFGAFFGIFRSLTVSS